MSVSPSRSFTWQPRRRIWEYQRKRGAYPNMRGTPILSLPGFPVFFTSLPMTSILCWTWGTHWRTMANSSGTVVCGSNRISWHAGSLGSKKVKAEEARGPRSPQAGCRLTLSFHPDVGDLQVFCLLKLFQMQGLKLVAHRPQVYSMWSA